MRNAISAILLTCIVAAVPCVQAQDEDPEIRKTFEYELGKNGLVSRMPRELYESRKAS